MRLSQGQLKILAECPRKYQHLFLESLTVPPSPEQLAAQQWGDRFHLLMQQREMGLPIDPVLAQDAELQACVSTLQAIAPELFDTTGETWRQSEHGRSLRVGDYWFTVVYDLLREWGDRAEIVDWKTYLYPRSREVLQEDWQTRLYLYVLAETSHYSPAQLRMTYWFVRTRNPETQMLEPQWVTITYSQRHHKQTHQALLHLCDRLSHLLANDGDFPQVPPDSPQCDRCAFAVRCQRGAYALHASSPLPPWDAIPEMTLSP